MERETLEAVDDVLSHYGKIGMKWGVRARTAAKAAAATRPGQPQPIMIGERPGHKLQTAGGRGHPAVDEAKRAAGLAQKARKSGVQSLTNKELKELTERINLEQSYSRLMTAENKATRSKGRTMVTEFVGKHGSKAINDIVGYQLTKAFQAKGLVAPPKKKGGS